MEINRGHCQPKPTGGGARKGRDSNSADKCQPLFSFSPQSPCQGAQRRKLGAGSQQWLTTAVEREKERER